MARVLLKNAPILLLDEVREPFDLLPPLDSFMLPLYRPHLPSTP